QMIGFVDRDLASIKPLEAAQFLRSWLKGWQAGPNQAQVNIQRGDAKLTIYIQFPESTVELLELLPYQALREPDPPAVPGAPEQLAIPADLLKDIQGRFEGLPAGYRKYLIATERKRLEDLASSKKG